MNCRWVYKAFSYKIQTSNTTLWWTFGSISLSYVLYRFLSVPPHLRHLPAVPILPIFLSYIRQEPDDVRIKRFLLPYANKHSEGVVLLWVFGTWMVHILDPKIASQVNLNLTTFPKFFPPWDIHLIRFTGRNTIITNNGKEWKRLSTIIRDAFTTPVPVDLFTSLSKNLFQVMDRSQSHGEKEVRVDWTDLAQRFALDAVGYSLMDYKIDAVGTKSQFVNDYNTIMKDIADPLYLGLPILDRIMPGNRHVLMNSFKDKLSDMLLAKRMDPGDDIMSFFLRDPTLTKEELRDNVAVLFIAAHDTTAGAISSAVYYLAVDQEVQGKAREEAVRVLGSANPSTDLVNPNSMPYIHACVREALRINPPLTYAFPRMTQEAVTLGKYHIPANTIVITDMYGIHHNEHIWSDPEVFKPERFLEGVDTAQTRGAWLAFSSGPRQCPAHNFAQYEMRTLISMLLREYEWTLPADSIHADGIKNAFSPFSLTLPHDLEIIFRKRA